MGLQRSTCVAKLHRSSRAGRAGRQNQASFGWLLPARHRLRCFGLERRD